MKKNRMMRLASVLLVAVLLTTCAISGTFAKYVTSNSISDKAHVAKWGVGISATGSLFEDTYDLAPANADIDDLSLAVESHTTLNGATNLVAPGTSNETGITIALTGQPEVAVHVQFVVTGAQDVCMPHTQNNDNANGKYLDYTTAGDLTDRFALANDYYPINYTLHDNLNDEDLDCDENDDGVTTLEEIQIYLNADDKYYDPYTNLETEFGSYTITWAWAFNEDIVPTGTEEEQAAALAAVHLIDQCDTFLGQYSAGSETLPTVPDGVADDFSIEAGINIQIIVTQVD